MSVSLQRQKVVPPGGKIYQAGFAIFSSTVDILLDLKVCFIATSKLYDWRMIQIYMFLLTFDL